MHCQFCKKYVSKHDVGLIFRNFASGKVVGRACRQCSKNVLEIPDGWTTVEAVARGKVKRR